jgi:hypothetical protein
MLALRTALTAFRRAPLLSVLSVTTIAFSLFAFGLFGLVALNLKNALTRVEERVEIRAFVAVRCASIRSRSDSAFASSVTSGFRAAEGESFRDGSSPGAFTQGPRNPASDRVASASYPGAESTSGWR